MSQKPTDTREDLGWAVIGLPLHRNQKLMLLVICECEARGVERYAASFLAAKCSFGVTTARNVRAALHRARLIEVTDSNPNDGPLISTNSEAIISAARAFWAKTPKRGPPPTKPVPLQSSEGSKVCTPTKFGPIVATERNSLAKDYGSKVCRGTKPVGVQSSEGSLERRVLAGRRKENSIVAALGNGKPRPRQRQNLTPNIGKPVRVKPSCSKQPPPGAYPPQGGVLDFDEESGRWVEEWLSPNDTIHRSPLPSWMVP